MSEKTRKVDPRRLKRGRHVVQVPIQVDDDLAATVEANLLPAETARDGLREAVLDALKPWITRCKGHGRDIRERRAAELEAQRLARQRDRDEARMAKLNSEMEQIRGRLGLHQDSVKEKGDSDENHARRNASA